MEMEMTKPPSSMHQVQPLPSSTVLPDIIVDRPSKTTVLSTKIRRFVDKIRPVVPKVLLAILALAWLAFIIAGCVLNFDQTKVPLIFTVIAVVGLLYYFVVKPALLKRFGAQVDSSCQSLKLKLPKNRWIPWAVVGVIVLIILIALAIDTSDNRYRLLSVAGLVFYVLLAWALSKHPLQVRWRPVVWGLGLQFGFALLILRWEPGRWAFEATAEQFNIFADYTVAGSTFVYGHLVTGTTVCVNGQPLFSGVFAFSVLMTIVFFSSVIALLYHLGALQFVIVRMALLMQYTMGTTAAESLSAAGNIFVGQTEAPLLIRPYLNRMTLSELHAVMTAGFATIAGTVFKIYVTFGACGNHLLSASVMSAPAALAVAKIVYPETEKSKTKKVSDLQLDRGEHSNALEAVAGGATSGIMLVLNIAANLISFLALLAFFNNVLQFLGECVNVPGLRLEVLCGWLFYPAAFLMGPGLPGPGMPDQVYILAELMGVKTFVNEFVAYQKMGEYIRAGQMTARTQLLATYALCGFSNLAAIGVQLGGIGAMCPERRPDLARVAFRALLAGTIACSLTACVAGILTSEVSECAASAANTTCALNLALA